MAQRHLSVSDAARRLNLSPQRIRALIASGDLPAERVGARYVLDSNAIGVFLQRERFGGRPLSSGNAWAVLAELSDRDGVVPVSRRSRYRLQELIQAGGDQLVRALGAAEPRAHEERWRVLPADLAELQRNSKIVLSGLAANDPSINVRHQVERDGLEGYVSREAVLALDRRLQPENDSSRPNLILKVPHGGSWILDEESAPPAVVAADLLNHVDPRVRRSARDSLTRAAHGH